MRVAVLAGIAAGTLIALQTAIISAFGERLPAFVVATWVHVGGLAFALAAIALTRTSLQFSVVRAAPWGLLAGVAGVLLITGIAVAVSGLGLASTLALVTGVQLLIAFALESSGATGRLIALDPVRIGGAALIVAGVYVVVGRGATAV